MDKQEEIKEVETPQVPEKIKVGEKEYDQAELEHLVGLGSLGVELEDKWDTKLDKLMPAYTSATQEKKALEEKLKVLETPKEVQDEEALKQEALQEAKKLGLLTKDDFETYYQQRRAGEKLLDETNSFLNSVKAEGKPVVETLDLLEYMAGNGFKDPQIAYKVMKEKELDAWKEGKLKELSPEPLVTETTTTAKTPQDVVINRHNSKDVLSEVLNRG